MSVPSLSDIAPRRLPQQKRGQERVSALLLAASQVLAEKGYEAATMSEIAERAHASIGSLYQFFPNKESIACALNTQCGNAIDKSWHQILRSDCCGDLQKALDTLIEATIAYIDSHPETVALQQAPRSTWNQAVRGRLERRIAAFLIKCQPQLNRVDARLYASVCMQLIKNCSEQYLHCHHPQRRRLICEYKLLLFCYAGSRLGLLQRGQ